jgi:hypothetical protein
MEIDWSILAKYGGGVEEQRTKIWPVGRNSTANLASMKHLPQTEKPLHLNPGGKPLNLPQQPNGLGPLRRDSVLEMVQAFKDRIKSKNCLQNFVINPEKCKRLQYWDLCLIVCMAHTALVSTYEVSFVGNNAGAFVTFVLKLSHTFVDLFFWCDTVFNFFLTYRLPRDQGEVLVRNQAMIAKHYLRGWFIVDFISVFPFTELARGIWNIKDTDVMGLRRIKLLDLLVLLRMFRFGRIAERWKADINVRHETFTVLKLSVKMCVYVHWMACLWGMLAVHQGPLASTWATIWIKDQLYVGNMKGDHTCMDRFSLETPVDAGIRNGALWEDCFWHNDMYAAAMYWAIMTLTSIGYGDIHATNSIEYYSCCIMMIAMAGVWAFLISNLCALASTSDPMTIYYHQKLDAVNSFLGMYKVDGQLVRRVRRYFQHTLAPMRENKDKEILNDLSPELAKECAVLLADHPMFGFKRFKQVDFMRQCAPFVQLQVLQILSAEMFAPEEPMHNNHCTLYILKSGLAALDGGVVTPARNQSSMNAPPPTWGNDFLLSNPVFKRKHKVFSLSFCELSKLTKRSLQGMIDKNPYMPEIIDFHGALRRSRLKLALHRAVSLIGKFAAVMRR